MEPLHSDIRTDPASAGPYRPAKSRARPTPAEQRRLDDAAHLKLDAPAQAQLGLQRRAPANLRRHVQRAAIRFAVLVVADLAAFGVLRELIRVLRNPELVGVWVSQQVQVLLPAGYLNGWQFACALFVGLLVLGNYGTGDRRRDPGRLFLACALASALPLWGMLWARGLEVVLMQYALTAGLVWTGVTGERLVLDRIIAAIRWRERAGTETIFVGTAHDCQTAMAGAAFMSRDFRRLGFIDAHAPAAVGAMGHISQFPLLLAASGAEAVVICGYLDDVHFHDVIDAALAAECQVFSMPRAVKAAGVQPTVVWKNGQALIELNRPVVRAPALFFKRVFDLVVGTVGLVLLLPIFSLFAVLIRLETAGPVFFASERWGQRGRTIRIWKFRTMINGASQVLDADPELRAMYEQGVKLRSDPRITRVGSWLRHWSLDELPQLFNVLRGEMSLVGPRPKLFGEEARYGALFPVVLGVPPGMTGLWQVSGRNNLTYEERIALDVDYVRRCSLWFDLRLLLDTVPVVIRGTGAH